MWFDLDYKSAKIDKKWNIGNFITSSYKTARGITVNGADASEVDLNKNLNAIVKDYGRNEKEYDTLYRELMLKRNETKKEISEMKASNAKFADIISAQNNDITIMGTQLRVLEDKQKLTSEKYKTMQAERKLWKELTAKQVVEEKPKSDDKAKADNKGKNSKIVEAEKAVSKKDKKQEKTESKKEPEKKGNDKKDASSKGNEKKDNGKKEIPLYHTVKADQTIYAISREYNVPVNRLLKLNPTLKNGKVVTGQKIKLKEK